MAAGFRYRVILVVHPQGRAVGLSDVVPADWVKGVLPKTVRIVRDREIAEETARRLRGLGAVVAIVEEAEGAAVFCPEHSDHLIAGHCRHCETFICTACMVASAGRRICAKHRRELNERARWLRTRQLVALFLFALFLYELAEHWRSDRERMEMGSTVHVLVMQYAPVEARYHPLLRVLNGYESADISGTSLVEMKSWLDGEFQRYTGLKRDYLDLHVNGPFFGSLDPPPLPTSEDGWSTQAWNSLAYVRYWKKLARERGVEPDSYGVMLVVVYGEAHGDPAADSRGSAKARLGVVHVGLDDANPTYPVITAAHELAHAFGALDKYDPGNSLADYPEGYVEPFVEPLYPQRYAELMAVDIPTSRHTEVEALELRQVRVGHRTAAELGWITQARSDLFYQPEMDPLERLYKEEQDKESLDMTTP